MDFPQSVSKNNRLEQNGTERNPTELTFESRKRVSSEKMSSSLAVYNGQCQEIIALPQLSTSCVDIQREVTIAFSSTLMKTKVFKLDSSGHSLSLKGFLERGDSWKEVVLTQLQHL